MDSNKSLDKPLRFIAALLRDVHSSHSEVYTPRQMQLDYRKIESRTRREGLSFLTKALPRLAKAFDRALTGEVPLDYTGFISEASTKLPKFLGSLFKCVFSHDGLVLPTPCVRCIATIRQVLLVFYKYELPYAKQDEQAVIDSFLSNESDILDISQRLSHLASVADSNVPLSRQSFDFGGFGYVIARARTRLARLFASFDVHDITPSHGPGAVSTKEKLWDKWKFERISPRTLNTYALDTFFYVSCAHVADNLQSLLETKEVESSARVVLVPKDSRGPRLISCEPLEFQWVQQGLSRAIVKHVETHWLTTRRVNFTDQQPNQIAALFGSQNGRYATLDLKDASDRISVGLVHLLFPEPLLTALMNCRSLSTELPSGEKIFLNKYAPMGSALCFPVLALCVWAILNAGAPDADTRERILVYGDDVIVPTAYAENAIELLELFGLKINRNKSCTKGFFRESCGTDAFAGVNVTPVRLRTVWSSHRCPHVYASWISYANSFYRKRYFNVYWEIAEDLFRVYGEIPSTDQVSDSCALIDVPEVHGPKSIRFNKSLQRTERKVWSLKSHTINREIDGWSMLLRYFTEGQKPVSHEGDVRRPLMQPDVGESSTPFSVRSYTKRDSIKLVKRWKSKFFVEPLFRSQH